MNPTNEILEIFESIRVKFENISNKSQKSKTNKMNLKLLLNKEYELKQNQLMNFFNDIINTKENIPLIIKSSLELKTWNLLIDRISKIIKHKIEISRLGKNFHVVLQNLYFTLIGDLRNNFEFFRNVYNTINSFEGAVPDLNVLVSNILLFMGDIKKLKLTLNKKFEEFKEYVNIEGDNKKDASEALKFYTYALNNYPFNKRIYSNLSSIYREFHIDLISSCYWSIRALACIDFEVKKLRDDVENDFDQLRIKFLKNDYIPNDMKSSLKKDIDHLPVLFYRIAGILYNNIDVDKLDSLIENHNFLICKILDNYDKIVDGFKFSYEISGQIDNSLLLCVFCLHYNLNNLKDYPNNPEKIIIPNNKNTLFLKYGIYSHNIKNLIKEGENSPKYAALKYSLKFISSYFKCVCLKMSKDNFAFIEKFLLIIFYYFSLNSDLYSLLVDEEIIKYLKFFNFFIQGDPAYLQKVNSPMAPQIYENINKLILPVESSFIGFIPLNNFFILNPKQGIEKIDDIYQVSFINRVVLIHFLNSFNLTAENIPEIANNFFGTNQMQITEKQQENLIDNDFKQKLFENSKASNRIISIGNVKKVKPLVLLDASNIAMRHGDKKFSTKGIRVVIDFFTCNGHQVLSFLPEYLFKIRDDVRKKNVVPDDIEYLNKLYSQKLVVQTPADAYDDSFCIQYCKEKNCFIVTNDLFRDYVEKISDNRKKESEKMWVKDRRIGFTFHEDEFIPNPDSPFFAEFNLNEYNEAYKNFKAKKI